MDLHINSAGAIRYVYTETVDLAQVGRMSIARGSHVEPDEQGRWHADLAPVSGPRLGPYRFRSEAIAAELAWLRKHWPS